MIFKTLLQNIRIFIPFLLCCLLPTLAKSQSAFYDFHNISEEIYDGNGTWGNKKFGYKMMLRDSYWRADTYRKILKHKKVDTKFAVQIKKRYSEVIDYLVRVEMNRGVFGIPADINNPEFGNKIAKIIKLCPSCINKGWITKLPPRVSNSSLYYDHGYALFTLSESFLDLKHPHLLPVIKSAADWILSQKPTRNTNYMSALSKGLASAFKATKDERYRDHAIRIFLNHILPNQKNNGEWKDSHNQKLEYHGFIVSGIIALSSIIPDQHRIKPKLDKSLNRALAIMKKRNFTESSSYKETWMGTNLMAWLELKELRALHIEEQKALDHCVSLIEKNSKKILLLKKFRLRKALYSNFILGAAR